MADRHALDVSNDIHTRVSDLVAMCAAEIAPSVPPATAQQIVFAARRRAMLDISYAGSPLVSEAGKASDSPAPGERFPANLRLRGESHHLLMFGKAPGLDRMCARWSGLVEIVDGVADHFDPAALGAPDGGVVLVRPDGFVGFRAAPADANTMAALDAHLSSYLIPSAGA
jgi:hypothetical protein